MPTAEDNFRVEVWDIEETACLETISRSSDFSVSVAAWQQALRRRPGRLLIHTNAGRVMEKMRSPGEMPAEPTTVVDGKVQQGLDAALRDLRKWHVLRAWCTNCNNRKPLPLEPLKKRFGVDVFLGTIEAKLTCTKCEARGPVRLEIQSAPRD